MMAQVTVTAKRTVGASVERVCDALADYSETRPKLLTEHFSGYQVLAGGHGEGTRVAWKLRATKKRVRDCEFAVTQPEPHQIVETDANSSMVTRWSAQPAGEGQTLVTVLTTWTALSEVNASSSQGINLR
ncbi:MAG: SRPBCC family protein [Sciscionella sp.]